MSTNDPSVPEKPNDKVVVEEVETDADPPSVSFFRLFRFADGLDIFLLIVGTVTSIAQGIVFPLMMFMWSAIMESMLSGPDVPTPTGSDTPVLRTPTLNPFYFPPDVDLAELCLFMTYIGIFAFVMGFFAQLGYGLSSRRQVAKIRKAYYVAVVQQDLSWFDTNEGGGVVGQRVTTDVSRIALGIGEKVSNLLNGLATLVAGLVVAFIMAPKMAAVGLAAAPLLVGSAAFMGLFTKISDRIGMRVHAAAGSIALDCLRNVRTVQAFNSLNGWAHRYRDALDKGSRAAIMRSIIYGAGFGSVYFIIFATYALCLWYGGDLLWKQEYNMTEVMTAFFSVIFGLFSVGTLPTNVTDISTARVAAARVFATIDRDQPIRPVRVLTVDSLDESPAPVHVAEDPGAPSPRVVTSRARIAIDIQNISFNYAQRPDQTVLRDVNLKIPAGGSVALVGESGCGKSTLLSIIARLYDPLSGSITYNGRVCTNDATPDTAATTVSLEEMRAWTGFVGQEPVLFTGTVSENLRYVNPTASDAAIQAVCKAANIHDTLSALPEGYNTDVGESGSQLSGGQKQRVAIARALLRDPAVLLLDEATSALDRASEQAVQEAIAAAGAGRTVITVAHRLSTIRHVDCIYVLPSPSDREAGTPLTDGFVEKGTHAQLMANKGLYYRMAVSQGLDVDPNATPVSPLGSAGPSPMASAAPERAPMGGAEELPSDKVVFRGLDGSAPRRSSTASSKNGDAEEEDDPATREYGLRDVARLTSSSCGAVGFFVMGMFGSFLSSTFYPAFAVFFAKMMAAYGKLLMGIDARDDVRIWALAFVGCAVTAFFGNFLQFTGLQRAGDYTTERIRHLLFDSLLRQDAGFFDDPKHTAASSTALLTESADKVHLLFGASLGMYMRVILSLVIALGIAFYYQWKLTLVVLATFPLVAFAGASQAALMSDDVQVKDDDDAVEEEADKKARAAKKAKQKEAARQKAEGATVSPDDGATNDGDDKDEDDKPESMLPLVAAARLANESLIQVRTIAMLSMEGVFARRYADYVNLSVPRELRNAAIGGLAFGFAQFLVTAAFALAFWYGGVILLQEKHEATFEDVMIVSMAILMSAFGAGEANQIAGPLASASGAANRALRVVYRPPAVPWDNGLEGDKLPFERTIPAPLCSVSRIPTGAAALSKVWFEYPARPGFPVLKGFSVDIQAGSFVGLVGDTGCGKSTVLALLGRAYNWKSGHVTIDGCDVQTIPAPALHDDVASVGQEPAMFEGTVRENVLAFCDEEDLKAAALASGRPAPLSVEEACKIAHIWDVVNTLPQGLETAIAMGRLSGGQKQRLAIARAVLRRPKILLLDEATSALDSATEDLVVASLQEYIQTANMTVISVAHRLTSIANADKIVVVRSGRVAEEGSLAQLLAAEGDFANRWRLYTAHP